MERAGSVKKSEKVEKETKKQEKVEKKAEAKRSESMKKIEGLKRQESVDTNKSPEGADTSVSESKKNTSMVSKLLGVMGRKGAKDHDEDYKAKKADKHAKKKNGSTTPQSQQPPKTELTPTDKQTDTQEDKRTKKGRGRASSSSSGEK